MAIDNTVKEANQALLIGLESKKQQQFDNHMNAQGEFINQVLERLANNPNVTDMQLRALYDYYQTIHARGTQGPKDRVGPLTGHLIESHHSRSTVEGVSPIYDFFKLRYDVNTQVILGADINVVGRPDFSVLSSQASFDYLKNLFHDKVSYVRGAYDDAKLYQAVNQKAKADKQQQLTFSLSNILDCMHQDICSNQKALKSYMQLVNKTFGAERPIYIMRVRKTQSPHVFEDYVINSTQDINNIFKDPNTEKKKRLGRLFNFMSNLKPDTKAASQAAQPAKVILEPDGTFEIEAQ